MLKIRERQIQKRFQHDLCLQTKQHYSRIRCQAFFFFQQSVQRIFIVHNNISSRAAYIIYTDICGAVRNISVITYGVSFFFRLWNAIALSQFYNYIIKNYTLRTYHNCGLIRHLAGSVRVTIVSLARATSVDGHESCETIYRTPHYVCFFVTLCFVLFF